MTATMNSSMAMTVLRMLGTAALVRLEAKAATTKAPAHALIVVALRERNPGWRPNNAAPDEKGPS